ncbi:hypothetical protein ACH34F_02750 [Elizabethkingia anophelis]|uniref:hypothetical protein n=1 Tax=Elizabethkingia anophelis TaxID=1117645 RepID=UPI000AB0EC47
MKVNNLTKLNTVFDTDFKNDDAMHTYMKTNKTECALRIFEADEELNYPQYVLDAIKPDGK